MSTISSWQIQRDKSLAIIRKVASCYATAKDAGDLLFFPSDVHTYDELNVKFQIRLCPALQHKPSTPATHLNESDIDGPKQRRPDPFAPPYNKNLYVGELRGEQGDESTEYVVLLNKYSVVPNHFLLVTKEYQSQTSPLSAHDLVQTYLLLLAARQAQQPYFAFFNCGERSGASQGHKHLQFLPIDDANGPPTEYLTNSAKLEAEDKPFSIDSLPYANYIRRLPFVSSVQFVPLAEMLQQAYLNLLELVIQAARHDAAYPAGRPSYNFILTNRHMYLIPRKEESHILKETGDSFSLNSLAFAGMLLVKNERELAAVTTEGIASILRGVGWAHPLNDELPTHDLDLAP